ncbi:phenylalanine--tRNA ligase subunit beta [Sphingomonas psychrotolerans]|uniref:Phenylalanine--tRNA ligase beta subunit n=1 Tax=Sphingomonas psychrotolerans TaxID=1327635 RepID=A0ABU3N484_9SPHN|nr:phenylalanine--tRNA ligase subunit beta [Sphingomonas psychrotolerans]MDT8759273.1 phenylalanine--tRNA ligase subunit beta [Sphingomonas psychrotolerans]
MKFTLNWLKEHLDTEASLDEVVETLTRVGLEVEGVDNPAEKLAAFRVAKVLTAERHPQADKLQVLTVDTGDGTPLQVVCGAPNARAGLVGVLGLPGATVPVNGMVLKVAAVRGVESNGMMCSTRELELGDDHDGIIELPADAPVGASFPDYAGLNDPVIDVSITPNRQDCMGVRGIARDLAAAGLGTLRPLEEAVTAHLSPVRPELVEGQSFSADQAKNGASTSSARTEVLRIAGQGPGPEVRIEAPEGCPAYFGQTVSGVTNGASPDWMQRRLKAIGQRPISALVDITNYVMIDLGRPLHVYDKAKLSSALVVREAKPGEQVLALNEKTYTLDETVTVIADANGVHDIGGIMGGEDTGVSEATTDVVIECAYFDPDHIARTGQKLNLTSDARSRFERGVDPAFLEDGIAIATRYVVDLCGGTASEVTRAGQAPTEPRSYRYNPALAETLGGLAVAADRQKAILESLGFAVDGEWNVTVPSWRRDVDGPADLVEEVIRIEGIDKVPSTPLDRVPGVARPTATAEQKLERKLRRTAAARGLHEAITWSFISEAEAAPFGGGAWTLANPISEDMKVMRPSLLPGLLAAAERNLKRGASGVRLFEIGRRYLADKEHLTLGVVLAGDRTARGWQGGRAQRFDAYDAKAEALALLEAAGAPIANLQVMEEAGAVYHPGQSATLRLGPKTVLAAFGMVHPAVLKAFDLDGDVAAVELYLGALPAKRGTGFMRPAYTPPALQAVTRDFAFLVPAELAAGDLVRTIKGADKAVITDARLFDVFTGTGVPEGQKSLAVEVTLQPGEKSFTDAELKAVADKIVAAAAKLGASLRG